MKTIKDIWDTEDECHPTNYDGTVPMLNGDILSIKEITCRCNPDYACGNCADIWRDYVVGDSQYIWLEDKE